MASKYRKNKAKFKWTKELVVLLVAIVALIAVTVVLAIPTPKERCTTKLNEAIALANANASSDSSGSSTTYSYLPNDNVFEDINHKKLVSTINKGGYVYVLYGSTNSTTILEQVSNINNMATDEDIQTVYFYSSEWVEETEDTESEVFKAEQKTIEDELNNNKSKDVEEFSLLTYPALLVYCDGSLIFNSQGYDNDAYTWSMYIQKAFMIQHSNQ
ncbi:TPA: hypothetical protein IAA91_03035 [Candidatus Avacholeplasma faecigallinarum]|nr:hypothetical protein [Candidatus Avacholeplasma faecigallinarum]